MQIICVCGYKRSGKSFVSLGLEALLVREFGYENVRRMSFSSPLKSYFAMVTGLDWDTLKDKEPHRPFFHRFADLTKELHGPHVFGEILARNACRWSSCVLDKNTETVVIVDDLRYPEELEAISKYGDVFILWIDSPAVNGHTVQHSSDQLDWIKNHVHFTFQATEQLSDPVEDCLSYTPIIDELVKQNILSQESLCQR